MKLQGLAMRGFMRFKEKAELEFPEGQVTLIEGENGAGKTSVLDALCVCLYGRTLRTSGNTKSGYLQLQDLVNHSSINADIEVQFENHGHNYVVTKRIPGGSKTQLLEDGIVKAIGADEVTHYVERIAIGLDWEAFSRSSVILQGEMSALSQLTPSQRKETLKKLFGLEKYDDYAGIAKERFDGTRGSIDVLEAANATLAPDIERIPAARKKVDGTRKDLGIIEAKRKTAETDLKQANVARDSLEIQSRKYDILLQTISGTENSIEEIESTIESDETDVDRLSKLEGKLPGLKREYGQHHELEVALKRMKPVKAKFDRLNSSLSNYSTLEKTKVGDLREARNELVQREQDLRSLKKQVPTAAEISSVRDGFDSLEGELKSISGKKDRFDGELKALRRGRTEIEANMGKVRGQSTCPVCFQKIPDPREVLGHYKMELDKNHRLIEDCRTQITSATKRHTELSVKKKQVQAEKQGLEERYARRKSIPSAVAQVSQQRRRVARLERELTKLAKKNQGIKEAIQKLGFDLEAYSSNEASLETMKKRKVVEHYIGAAGDVKHLPAIRRRMASRNNLKRRLVNKLEQNRKKLSSFGDVNKMYREAKQRADRAQEEFSNKDRGVTEQATELRNQEVILRGLEDKEKQQKKNVQRIGSQQKQAKLFQILREIFRNIPDDVLRRIRPVIEAEGSEIVTSLSDNEITGINLEEANFTMSATSLGQKRPIEYYSGGQKTRINMALRIAISRILTKLPSTEEHTFGVMETLFIDEGDFGYLDEAGIRDTIESVRELTKVFSRVIIISHVDTFRELFHGNAIRVVKTGDEMSSLQFK